MPPWPVSNALRRCIILWVAAMASTGPRAIAEVPAQACNGVFLTAAGGLECTEAAQPDGVSESLAGLTFGPGLDIVGQPVLLSSRRLKQSNSSLQMTWGGLPTSQLTAPLSRFSISSRFGERRHPILRTLRMHSGIDMAAPTGSSVYAAADGLVAASGWDVGYGLNVRLLHPGSVETRYGHLSTLDVAPGQRVVAGQLIGRVGSTGLSTGPHLHYELRVNGIPVDPSLLRIKRGR